MTTGVFPYGTKWSGLGNVGLLFVRNGHGRELHRKRAASTLENWQSLQQTIRSVSFVSISTSDMELWAVFMIAFSWPRPSHVTEICPLLSVSSRVLCKLVAVSASWLVKPTDSRAYYYIIYNFNCSVNLIFTLRPTHTCAYELWCKKSTKSRTEPHESSAT